MASVDITSGAQELQFVRAAIQWARRELSESRTAALDAEILMAHVLGCERSWVLAHDDAKLSASEESLFGRLVARRTRGEPVAYLVGRREWYAIDLEVTPDVLIPRPETELVLERAVTAARQVQARTVADVGTGSGALAIGLAIQLSDANILATDISEAALAVARRNVERLNLTDRITVLCGNLLHPIADEPDLVVANLPYLSDDMMVSLDRDVRFEPAGALYGGATGLELYREMLRQAGERGWRCPMVLEIDPWQAGEIRRLPGYTAQIEPDYSGHARIALLNPRQLA